MQKLIMDEGSIWHPHTQTGESAKEGAKGETSSGAAS